jgi:hypothetical protein
MIIMIISFTKRLLIKLGQRFILSDKALDKLYVVASLFFCSESRSVTCARQHHASICCSSQLHPPLQLLNYYQLTSEFFVITMVSYSCRCVMGSQVSRRPSCRILPNEICKSSPYFPSPTWPWKSSPIATIFFGIHWIDPSVCLKCIPHRVKVWRGCEYSIVFFP